MEKRCYRDLFGISGKWLRVFLEIFGKPVSSWKFLGLRLDYNETQGPLCKILRIIDFWIYFLMEKAHGLSPWRRWSMVDRALAGRRGSLELSLAAAPEHVGSPMMAQRRERSTGSPSRASPGHGWWRGDRVMVVKKWWRKCSVRASLGHREKRRRMMRFTVEDGEAGEVLTRAQEEVQQPGDDSKVAVGEELS
jgi:hypothetical protein